MSFLRFAREEVREMAGTLEDGGGRMKGASKEMARTDSSQLGDVGLQSACDKFADSWDYGFGQLSKLTKGVSKFANKAAEEFEKLDKKLCDELEKAKKHDKKS